VAGGLPTSTKTVTVENAIASATRTEPAAEISPQEIYARDAPGVVFVSATGVTKAPSPAEVVKGEGGEQGTSTGSGFEVDHSGTILTNWHVVENAVKVLVSLGEHGRTIQARVLGEDPSRDLAVLRIPSEGITLHPLTLGLSRDAQVGEPVVAIGNPFGYARTLTTGVVSALGRQIAAPDGVTINGVLQTDAPLNPGSSGGPLLNAQGDVIGINSEILSLGGNGGDVGISFSIPIDPAKSELAKLERG
jgi:S1-C subfamily serine protease